MSDESNCAHLDDGSRDGLLEGSRLGLIYRDIISKRYKNIIFVGMGFLIWMTNSLALTWMTGHEMAYLKGHGLV